MDLLAAHDAHLAVLMGKGDGGFEPAVAYPVGVKPESLAAGDFNRDGKLDLAVANFDSRTLTLLLGKEGGGFLEPLTYSAGASPAYVVGHDLDGDGGLELVVAHQPWQTLVPGYISVFRDRGGGIPTGPSNYSVRGKIRAGALGDFNRDGTPDAVLTTVEPISVWVSPCVIIRFRNHAAVSMKGSATAATA